jgi:hypothetical protein
MKMKTTKIIAITLLGILVSMSSCKKDKEEVLLEKNYFTVQNGTYMNSAFPTASSSGAPSIASLVGNPTVLAGGSNPITINTNSTVTDVLVGVQGQTGYFKIPVSSTRSINQTIMVLVLLSQNASQNFTIVFALANGSSISAPSTVFVTVLQGGTGKLQVSMSWNKANDVDLHLVEPGGEEIYFGNSTSANGGELDVDSNAGCSIDNINNENITYSNTDVVANGVYTVNVNLWSTCQVSDPTTYVVTVRYNGNIIAPLTGTNPFTGTLLPSDEDIYKTPMTFRIGAAKNETVSVLNFNFPDRKREVLSPQKME